MELTEIRAEASARISELAAQVAELIAASEGSNADDEHDPEGATIAFERQQLLALLGAAERSLAEIDLALARIARGEHGTCADCSADIGQERRSARPAATRCIDCAHRQAVRR